MEDKEDYAAGAMIDLSGALLEELLAYKHDAEVFLKRIGEELEKRKESELARATGEFLKAAELWGVSPAELLAIQRKPKRAGTQPPKYFNPDKPEQTWNGNGQKPGWMKRWIDSGKDPLELLIQKCQLNLP